MIEDDVRDWYLVRGWLLQNERGTLVQIANGLSMGRARVLHLLRTQGRDLVESGGDASTWRLAK